jgi:hypothetical protein
MEINKNLCLEKRWKQDEKRPLKLQWKMNLSRKMRNCLAAEICVS